MSDEHIPTGEAFLKDGLKISDHTLLTSDYDSYFDDLLRIDPSMLSSLVLHGDDVEWRAGKSVLDDFTIPKIEIRVGYRVALLLDEKSEKMVLASVQTLENPETLKNLLKFLANIEVSNTEDLFWVRLRITDFLLSKQTKT